jgi:hypothetical protein
MFKFAAITGRDDIAQWLYAKREKLTVLTELLTPKELLAAWDQVWGARDTVDPDRNISSLHHIPIIPFQHT